MEDPRWHRYFSENVNKFRSGSVGFVGLFVFVEACGRLIWPGGFAAMSPVLDLGVFCLCFVSYWLFERRFDDLPDRGWSVSPDRGAAELEVGGRRRTGGAVLATVVFSVCAMWLCAPEQWLGATFLVVAAWLLLHRMRARDMWGYLSIACWGSPVIGSLWLVMPAYAAGDGTLLNILIVSEFGIALMVAAVLDHRVFVRHVGLRGE